MGANPLSSSPVNGADLVVDHLLTSIHLGRLRPGDRVPSVRRLAEITSVNHKTVHRAYTSLVRDGILEVRAGSGTFVRCRQGAGLDASLPDLLGALESLRAEANRLGVTPDVLSDFFGVCFADGLRDKEMAVVECNWEQIAMIGRDLRETLGVHTRPIRLDALERNPSMALGGLASVLTTDCHYAEVVALLEPLGVSVHTITLDSVFPRRVLEAARTNDVLMVIRDEGFARTFSRLLDRICRDERVCRRVRFVIERDALRAFGEAPRGTHVYISPLVRTSILRALPRHARHVDHCWHVESNALEMLRAALGMEQVLQPRSR